MLRILSILIILGYCCLTSFAQITAPIKKVDGVDYYMHKVEKGQTLYAISKVYNVGIKQIQADNALTEAGISEGQILKIKKETSQAMTNPTHQLVMPERNDPITLANSNYHQVVQGETFYSIAQKYQMTVDELKSKNPSFENALHPGDLLMIKDTAPNHRSIKRSAKDDSLRIILLLPFFASVDDSVITPRQKVIRQTALHIYRGMLLTTDTLEKLGKNVSIQVIDFENNVERLKSLITVGAFEGAQVVIGPLFKESLEVTADWAEKNEAWVVCPVPITNKILMNNPRLVKAFPSDVSLWASTSKYVMSKKSATVPVFLYKGKSEAEKKKAEAFQSGYQKGGGKFLKVSANMDSLIDVAAAMKDSCVIVLPTASNGAFGKINKRFSQFKNKMIFGVAEWQDEAVQEIAADEQTISKFKFYFPKSYDFERMNDMYLDEWISDYHRAYFSQPNEYSLCGYDILMAFSLYPKSNKLNFVQFPMKHRGVASNLDLLQVGSENGFENVGLIILQSNAGMITRVK